MTRPRCLGRLAAAATGALAASALALTAAPAAGAQAWIPSQDVDVSSFVFKRVLVPEITNPCLLPSRPCDLYLEEPRLFPDPDPGDFRLPVAQLDLATFQLPQLQGPGLAVGG